MLSAADAFHEARPRLDRLVKRAEARTGSRMLAYGEVARGIGASPSWVRKVIGNQTVSLPGHVVLNILAAYDAACARWEAEAAVEKRRFLALSGASHADSDSADQGVALAACPASAGEGRAAGMAPDVVDTDGQRLSPPPKPLWGRR